MLIFVGSRRKGNCYNLAHKIQKELNNDHLESEIIIPGKQRIFLCTGCRDCEVSGICDFKDDMQKIIPKIKEEKVLLFITPARFNAISSDLKVMIDRLNPLYPRQELKNKKMIIVAIGAKEADIYSTEQVVNNFLSIADAFQMDPVIRYEFNNCLNPDDILKQESKIQNLITDIKKELIN